MTTRTLTMILSAGLVSAVAVSANATATYLTVAPDINTPFVAGNNSTAAPGFGSSSFQAAAITSGQKSEVYIPVSSLFASPVTIGDIQSISYWTNKGTTAADPDWTLLLYTKPTGTGDSASWYKSRLNSEPYFTGTPSVTANTWHQWSTNDSTNPMRFYDQPRGGNFGTYTDPTLSDLKAGNVTWANSTTHDYSAEQLNLISLQTGSAWAPGFTGLVDGVTVTLTNGDVGYVNLVPAPGAVALAGLAGLVGLRRRR